MDTYATTAKAESGVGLLNGCTVITNPIAPLFRGRVRGGRVVVGSGWLSVQSGHRRRSRMERRGVLWVRHRVLVLEP